MLLTTQSLNVIFLTRVVEPQEFIRWFNKISQSFSKDDKGRAKTQDVGYWQECNCLHGMNDERGSVS